MTATLFTAAHVAARLADKLVAYRTRFTTALRAAWATAKQTTKTVMKKQTNEFTFSAFGSDYTATIWNKVAGKERIYIKENGQDIAVANMDGTSMARTKGTWGSPSEKLAVAAALLAARAEVEPVAPQAAAPVAVAAPAQQLPQDADRILTHADAKAYFAGIYLEQPWNR